MTAATLTTLRRGRPSASDLASRADRAERRADNYRLELRVCATEMVALGNRIDYSIRADRPDIASHVAGRLVTVGQGYLRRSGGAA